MLVPVPMVAAMVVLVTEQAQSDVEVVDQDADGLPCPVGPSPGGGAFSPGVVPALLWAASPIVAATGVRHGEQAAGEALMTLLLGWLGLAVVAYGSPR